METVRFIEVTGTGKAPIRHDLFRATIEIESKSDSSKADARVKALGYVRQFQERVKNANILDFRIVKELDMQLYDIDAEWNCQMMFEIQCASSSAPDFVDAVADFGPVNINQSKTLASETDVEKSIARERAFADAQRKATQLALLSKSEITAVFEVVDVLDNDYDDNYNEVTVRLNVKFRMN